jgi:hypothetical protein
MEIFGILILGRGLSHSMIGASAFGISFLNLEEIWKAITI